MTFRSAYEDLVEFTLPAVPGKLAQLDYLAGLREGQRYDHWGLASVHGEEAAHGALRRAHEQVFLEVLRAPLRELWSEAKANATDQGVTVQDSAGSTAATYTYDAFGQPVSSTGSIVNPFRYTGREWDEEVGLYFYRARYYDRFSGRFLSEDPIAFAGGVNFFTYVGNQPTTLIDPSGLAECLYQVSKHTLVCWPNGGGTGILVGPDSVSSGAAECRDSASRQCLNARNKGPIVPGRYKMNADDRYPGEDRYRLEPWPNDLLTRAGRRLRNERGGFQLHRGGVTIGCINVLRDDPKAMAQYDTMVELLVAEDGANFLTVVE